MSRLVFIVHGVGGSSNSCWIPWLKEKLEKSGFKVIAPSFPSPQDPEYLEWQEFFLNIINEISFEELYIVGHSLGGFFVQKFLGECYALDFMKKLKGVLLVSPTSTKRPERRKFYKEGINWDNIRKLSPKITLMYSDDDPKISPDHAALTNQELGCLPGFQFKHFADKQHFIVSKSIDVLEAFEKLVTP